MSSVFDSPAYRELEAQRIHGEPVVLDITPQDSVGMIRREIAPGTGEFDAVSVYGYPRFPLVASEDEFRAGLAALQGAGRDAGLLSIYLRLQPDAVAPRMTAPGIAGVEVGSVVAVDLTETYVNLLGAYRSQLRYDVRKFQGLYATDRSPSKSAEFAALYFANMDRVNAAQSYYFSPEYFAALSEMEGVAYWFLRTDAGELAAAALIIDEGDTLYYHLGASDPVHARRASMKVLLSRIIEHHADRSWKQLVLGGGLGGGDDTLLRFKRGFSSLEHRVFGVRIICDLARYGELCGTTDPTSGYFPAYRKPQ